VKKFKIAQNLYRYNIGLKKICGSEKMADGLCLALRCIADLQILKTSQSEIQAKRQIAKPEKERAT